MTTPVSNIIAFPVRRVSAGDVAALPLANGVEVSATTSSPPAVVSMWNGSAYDATEEEWLNAATLVRAAIRHARRKGVALASLPPALRHMLLQQCDRGQPACLMVRDWLTGNRPFLAIPGIEEEAQ
ncbi:hypothetical protein [Rhizobium sp. 9140]|uniref:hypothetical protein n=1 Tax=Rhizobium sp. 9140 TaxID=1761900 RepID=UPI000799275D|nr:hypothetical protein [Rhizobium sp. 9140]CZT38068.1 hypothetical protein GA0004734_00049430 [Rhizobium sp. 9140]